MGVLPDTAAASAGSAGCSFTKGSLWRSLRPDTFQKRHESLKQRRCAANELAETPRRHGNLSHDQHGLIRRESNRTVHPLSPMVISSETGIHPNQVRGMLFRDFALRRYRAFLQERRELHALAARELRQSVA